MGLFAVKTRQRHNPFNRASLVLPETPAETDGWSPGETDGRPTDGAAEPHGTTAGEPLSPPKGNVGGLTDDLSSESSGSLQGTHTELTPVPKKRTIIFGPLDSLLDSSSSPFPRLSGMRGSRGRVAAPRGILKHSISWNSNDSGLPYDGQRQGQPSADTPKLPAAAAPERESSALATPAGAEDEISDDLLDTKQVRFSPPVSLSDATGGPELWEGREFGDQDLLDLDRLEPSDKAEGAGLQRVGSQRNEGSDVPTFRSVCEQPAEGDGSCLDAPRAVREGPPALLLSNEPEMSWMAYTEHPSCESVPPPVSEPRCRWKGQHENHAESKPSQVPYLLPSVGEKCQPGYVGIGGHDAPAVLAVQSPELTEEEGDSIAKVLEWFSRSSDSSDQQEGHICQQEMDMETKNQQEAPSDDDTTNTKMVFGKDQPVAHKDHVTTINEMMEHTLSDGPLAGEVQSANLRRVLLKRSTRIEEEGVVHVEGVDKDLTPIAQGKTVLRIHEK
ncbi:hypothetical protein AAFF_G00237810 [Aldrovandia affinis]|uniref:Uncharacterized protein n=1 Tax=Aldrovandia affinis TaxID=143900 RepID=A0AAD7REC8_9TELE|nr:hypothetical protein AAFF_G00237810 [Aldrovandia affinis]